MTRTQLMVRHVRPALEDARLAVVMCPLGQPDGPSLALPVGAAEAHTLFHELNGQDTPRGHAMWLVGRVVDALGGHLRATRLTRDDDDDHELAGVLEIEAADGIVEVSVCATQALAVAARLGLPLVADTDLLETTPRSHIEAAVADIVNGLHD
jgi:bifunctional DNase/RNase